VNNIPDKLRLRLLAAGYTRIDIGNVHLHLETGTISRTITVTDRFEVDKQVVDVAFPSGEIDWDVVVAAVL
jgi:hypothetical protein